MESRMDDQQLQQWVEQLSLQYFGRPFSHQASFNARLRSTGGRYFTSSHNIEISWQHFASFGLQEVESIIKHELCHYHLHLTKKGYKHRDPEFKQLLEKVGGSRYCQALPGEKRAQPYRYRLICTRCKMEYLRKRKLDPKKYVCGRCRGKLQLVQLDFKINS